MLERGMFLDEEPNLVALLVSRGVRSYAPGPGTSLMLWVFGLLVKDATRECSTAGFVLIWDIVAVI